MTAIKICCIRDEGEIALADRARADAVGLVGPMPSGPGQLDDATIARLAAATPPPVMSVLLTSRTEAPAIVAHARAAATDAVQIVSPLPPGVGARVREALPDVTVIRVIHVASAAAVEEALRAAAEADMLLLDSGMPTAAVPTLGGTGRAHDWALSAEIVGQSPVPVWLAGGLTPDNVGDAVAQVRPFGVDVCSGLRPRGPLDPARLHAFVTAVRAADGVSPDA